MKISYQLTRLFLLLGLFCILCGKLTAAVTNVTATITVTNAPTGTNGEQIIFQGQTYIWTNVSPVIGEIEIDTNNGLAGDATNLFNQLSNDFSGTLRGFSMTASNSFKVSTYANGFLTISNSAGWMTNGIVTNITAVGAGAGIIESNITAITSMTLNGSNITSWPSGGGGNASSATNDANGNPIIGTYALKTNAVMQTPTLNSPTNNSPTTTGTWTDSTTGTHSGAQTYNGVMTANNVTNSLSASMTATNPTGGNALLVNGTQTNTGAIYVKWNGTAGQQGVAIQPDGGIITGGYFSQNTLPYQKDLVPTFIAGGMYEMAMDVPWGLTIINPQGGNSGGIVQMGGDIDGNGDGHFTNSYFPSGNMQFQLNGFGQLFLNNYVQAQNGIRFGGTSGYASGTTNAQLIESSIMPTDPQGSISGASHFAFKNYGPYEQLGYTTDGGMSNLVDGIDIGTNGMVTNQNNLVVNSPSTQTSYFQAKVGYPSWIHIGYIGDGDGEGLDLGMNWTGGGNMSGLTTGDIFFNGRDSNHPLAFGVGNGNASFQVWSTSNVLTKSFYGYTNVANVTGNTTAIAPGVVNVGPAQRFSVSLTASATATLSVPALVSLVYSNAESGVIESNSFSIPAGILASDTVTNMLMTPVLSPNSRYWLTNGAQAATVLPGTSRLTLQ